MFNRWAARVVRERVGTNYETKNDGGEARQGDAEWRNVGALMGHTKLTFWWLLDRNLNDDLEA
jgi:hypothetical protein